MFPAGTVTGSVSAPATTGAPPLCAANRPKCVTVPKPAPLYSAWLKWISSDPFLISLLAAALIL